MNETKVCVGCGDSKTLITFKPFIKKDGTIGTLAKCSACRWREGKERSKNGILLKHSVKNGRKTCSLCLVEKPVLQFHKHNAIKSGVASICKICQKNKDSERYKNLTPEQIREIYSKRKEDSWKHSKNYKLKNVERCRESRRKYIQKPENRKRDRIQTRIRFSKMSDAKRQEFYDKRRESTQKARMKRRARERNCNIIISFTKADIIKRDGLSCYLCGKSVTEKELHLEHVLPISRGGNHKPENVKVSCSFCNHSKGSKTLVEYKKYRGDYERFKTPLTA